MRVLAWWLIPIGITLLALAWAVWRNRPRKPLDVYEAAALREQMRAALERPMPTHEPSRRRGANDGT